MEEVEGLSNWAVISVCCLLFSDICLLFIVQ